MASENFEIHWFEFIGLDSMKCRIQIISPLNLDVGIVKMAHSVDQMAHAQMDV